MTNLTTLFPHERLIAYQVACELLDLVRELRISHSKLRDQGMRAAQSACLNIAEAAGRFGGPTRRGSSQSLAARPAKLRLLSTLRLGRGNATGNLLASQALSRGGSTHC
jgi:hypothetical protein